MTTLEELDNKVREVPLLERLNESQRFIGEMCVKGRPPLMSIPVQWDDEDQYITVTLKDAIEEIKRLRAELKNWQDAFAWVEQHLTSLHVGFSKENAVKISYIDKEGYNKEAVGNALLDIVQERMAIDDIHRPNG